MNESYIYIEQSEDTLPMLQIVLHLEAGIKPVMWAQAGRYGWISKEQLKNLWQRQKDLEAQQKGYAKDKPLTLQFYWHETTPLDPTTVKLMRATSP